MEELRQREANLTALLAIGPRKKPKLDENSNSSISGVGPSSSTSTNVCIIVYLKRMGLRLLITRILFFIVIHFVIIY